MLDFKFIKDNLDLVKANIARRNVKADADLAARLYSDRCALEQRTDDLRRERNENAAAMKGKLDKADRDKLIARGQKLKEEIGVVEAELAVAEKELKTEAGKIPNLTHPDVPDGVEERDSRELDKSGTAPTFDFPPKDHLELGRSLDILDFETAQKVAGQKWYYLKNEGVLLELALVRYAFDMLRAAGFTITATPDVAREEIVEGIGFAPRGPESNIYRIEDEGLCLIGTAEITLGGAFADTILKEEDLPLKIAGVSHCFRREAGAAGQFSKGLYRVHQFTKVEMFIFCRAGESDAFHDYLLNLEKKIFSGLDIPFRVVDTCAGDLGNPAYRKFDLEAWMPGRGDSGDWGEITSTSNCTDYQSRRLQIRYKEAGKSVYAHMLNGTAVAVSRALIAILENFQQADGSVRVPPALVPYAGFDVIKKR